MKKGSIVWYYDRVLDKWCRGQINTINKHYLIIRKRHHAYSGRWARYRGLVILASEPKPSCTPEDLTMKLRLQSGWSHYWQSHYGINIGTYRLLQRLGIK